MASRAGEGRTSRALPSVEAAALAVGFATALRRAGLVSSMDRAAWLAEAIRLVPPHDRDRLYWTCRVVFVTSSHQLALFDAVFSAVFDGMLDPADSRGDSSGPAAIGSEPRTISSPPDDRPTSDADHAPEHDSPMPTAGGDDADEAGRERDAMLMMASTEERLHDMSFAELETDEVDQVRALVRKIVLSTPPRRSRRTRASSRSSDRLDVRRTLRAAQRSGADATRLVYSRRREHPRRLVLLCDVSGSMEPYTRVFLSLLQGAVAGAHAEAFVFSTRLTRLTRELALRNPDLALARAAKGAPDWAGGTRLAESIRRFVDDFGRRGLARGAVVVILSDGWAHDDPDRVSHEMARLKRLVHRIVWVNPRKVAVGFEPLVGGMAAALPHCDAFVSGHSFTALTELAAAISTDRRTMNTEQRNR